MKRRRFIGATSLALGGLATLKAAAWHKAAARTGLGKLYENDFTIGTALSGWTFSRNDTELLDLVKHEFNSITPEINDKLTKRYEDLFKLFLKHRDKIDRVTFWGTTDAESWKNNFPVRGRTNYPLLFDRERKPKNAYHAVAGLKK